MVLGLVALSMACAAPGQPADAPEPTDAVLVLRVETSPSPELIEPIITAKYGPKLLETLPADDGSPLDNYTVAPPIVSPWGWDFRLNAETPGPLKATVRIKARRTVQITCKWYLGITSTKPVWVDKGYGETVCQYLMEK